MLKSKYWISLIAFFGVLALSSVLHAQDRAWELSVRFASFNTYYQENFANPADGDPEDVRGNSWSVLSLDPIITYRAQQDFNVPIFVGVEAQIPLETQKRLEIGDEYEPAGMTDLTQEEQVAHNDLYGRAIIGWEWRSFLQPYVGIVRSRFTSERTAQLNGDEEGDLTPDPNQDYTETVFSTSMGIGIQGMISLEKLGYRIRYDGGVEIPVSVFVSNGYFGPGTWGQGTTGYTLSMRAELDILLSSVVQNSYFSIGGLLTKREWNGNGRTASVWYEGYPETAVWPQNYSIQAGGFIGYGMAF